MENERTHQVHYELEELDNLIQSILIYDCSKETPSTQMLEEWQHSLTLTGYAIQKKLACDAFILLKEKHVRSYVQNHQSRICYQIEYIAISREYHALASHDGFNKTLDTIVKVLYDLLDLLSSQFKEHFNFETKATIAFKQKAIQKFHAKMDSIKLRFDNQQTKLLSILFNPIDEFLAKGLDYPISFSRLIYYEYLLTEIACLEFFNENPEDSLKLIMISLNFNSARFFNFLTREIENELDNEDSFQAKLERLVWHLKKYKQISENCQYILMSSQPSIKTLVISWITEEISYYEKTIDLIHSAETNHINQNRESFKLQSNLSVSQLAYFLRLACEAGVFGNENLRDFIKFMASNTATKQAGNISAESLRAKFYSVENGTKEVLKDIVIKMLNDINKKN